MTRTFGALVMIVLSGCAACWAADNPIVGKWDCKSDDGSGTKVFSILAVKEEAGKLSGSLTINESETPLVEPKLEGNTFTFKFVINPQCTVETTVKIEGNKFEGKFTCPDVSGTIAGAKQP